MASDFTPKSNKPVDRIKLKAFREGFDAIDYSRKVAISKRKKALKRTKF